MSLNKLKYIAVLIFLFSCSKPLGILNKADMQATMWDIFKADAYCNQFIKKDSTKNDTAENIKLQQQIFALHHTTKENYDKSYQYYLAQPMMLQQILDSMSVQSMRAKYMPINVSKPKIVEKKHE